MSKHPKSIVISFRLSPAVIAKAIDGLKNYNKSADITKLSTIIKQTTLHGINYLTHALPFEPSTESQIIVHNLTIQGKKNPFDLEQSIIGQELKNIGLKKESKPEHSFYDITAEHNKTSIKSSDSIKSVVNDFSMPKDLRNEIEEGEEE